ncbi:hypothetical protein B0H11DRAFT_2293197 [Mycena galericulata]|nr:hypothetical protein B0H11DRAFT_2293197 [Mycena galericulata]
MDIPRRPPSLEVQEIRDHIISFLRGMTRDLKNCALVSTSLRGAAQSVLFHDIDLDPTRYIQGGLNGETLPAPSDFDAEAAAACRRLGAVVAHSPHLIKHIRRLKIRICSHPDVIVQLLAMGLTHLRDISLDADLDADSHDLVIEPLQSLIGLPSVREVTVSNRSSPGMLSGRVHHLTAISFNFIRDFNVKLLAAQPDTDLPRPQITKLTAETSFMSSHVEDWLVGPRCPFDLTRLVDVHVAGSGVMGTSLSLILKTARGTIERLQLAAYDLKRTSFDFAAFPLLRYLHIYGECVSDLASATSTMSTLEGHPSVRFVTLEIREFSREEWADEELPVEEWLHDLDAAFAGISIPMLEELEIYLYPELEAPLTSVEEAVLFREALPTLNASGILAIRSEAPGVYERTRTRIVSLEETDSVGVSS